MPQGNWNPQAGRLYSVVGIFRLGRRQPEKVWLFDERVDAYRSAIHLMHAKPRHDVIMGLMSDRTRAVWWGDPVNPERVK